MDLNSFVDHLSNEQMSEEQKAQRMEAFLKSYEINLVRNKLKKKLNLKRGIVDGDIREALTKDSDAQTEGSESKIVSEDLKILWKSVQIARSDHESRLTTLQNTLNKVSIQMQRVEKFCGNYQLLWKIRNFAQILQDAKEGKKLVIQSPVFDSHRNGYKLQLNLCPNGEGRGTSDSFLPWPYACSTTFILLNPNLVKHELMPKHKSQKLVGEQKQQQTIKEKRQNPNLENVEKNGIASRNSLESEVDIKFDHDGIETPNLLKGQHHSLVFQPGSNPAYEPFLMRPVEDRNKSLGFPKFILLGDLLENGFITNDTIYIKVLVDISQI